MNSDNEILVQCEHVKNDGTRCEREMRVHVYFKFWTHYCRDHGKTAAF